jgi:predicted Zn-dependent protease
MYIPLCLFFDGITPKGLMAETEIDYNGIKISYTTAEGEKKEVHFEYTSIQRIIRRPGNKILILFGTSQRQMLELRAMPQVVAILKLSGHRPEYNSPFDRFSTGSGKIFTLVAAIIALALCVYLYIIPAAADLFAQSIPASYEINLGKKIYQQIITHDTIDTLKTNIVNRFAKQIDFNTEYEIKITVVHGKEVNAFATPGGHIIIYDTLLNQIENPNELAALLSHEATHIKFRHSLRALSSDLSRSIFLSIIFHDRNSVSTVLAQNANMLNSLSFSRKMERVADEGAIRILLNNNFDPDGMVQLLNLLKRQDKNNGNLTYLSTHPATDERIADVEGIIDANNIRIIPNNERNQAWQELHKKTKK